MPAEPSRINNALSLVASFAKGGAGKGFARIDRRLVVNGLRERIATPATQNQATASLCGPAAFFYCLLEERPELYAQYVIDLFETGEARIKALHVKPSAACRAYLPPPNKIAPVDWIALASLRDSDNSVLSYSSADDEAAGITMPHSLAKWFRETGFRSVKNNTNLWFLKGRREIEDCARDVGAYRRVCLFVNVQILDAFKRTHRSWVPNHWVVLARRPAIGRDTIRLAVYSWGRIIDIPAIGDYSLEGFHHNFYGYVSATPA